MKSMKIIERAKNKIKHTLLVNKVRRSVDLTNVSLISMNCIGGVFYHDVEARFLTPTINLFFTADDFIKFVNHMEHYLSVTPIVTMGKEYPVGQLDDIKIYFMHFNSIEDALSKWEERKKRINPDRVFVIMVEQNGFTDQNFHDFLRIKYPKILFTRNPNHQSDDIIYFEKYRDLEELPNIIDKREFYKDMKLPQAVNKAYN